MIIGRWHTCILAFSIGLYLILLYRVNIITNLLELRQSIHLPFNDGRRNDQAYINLQTERRKQTDVCSSEAEMAMRVLIRDEQELWNILAAQLQLHKKETLPTIDNVIASILEYKSALSEDVELYQSKLEAETSENATTLLRILTDVDSGLKELFNATLYELKRIRKNKDTHASQLTDDIKSRLRFLHIKVSALLQKLRSRTNPESKSSELSNEVQKHIQRLQYPMDCVSTRKLLCSSCGGCGLGCNLHHIGMCQVTAYLSNRTMILDCHRWRYSKTEGWEAAFLPISNCTEEHIEEMANSTAELDVQTVFNQTIPRTIRMKFKEKVKGTDFFPPAVPTDILHKTDEASNDVAALLERHVDITK